MKQKDDISIELVDAREFRQYLSRVKYELVNKMEKEHRCMDSHATGYLIASIINKLDEMIIGD